MLIELNDDELDLVVELLGNELQELGQEIRHTDTRDYREGLKARRELLASLAERLQLVHPVS